MMINDNLQVNGPTETPGEWSGGLPFIAGFIPIVVILTSLVIATLLNQITTSIPKTSDTGNTQQFDPLINKKIAPLFTPEVQYWSYKIIPWSKQYGLDPNLIATVMQIESCGYKEATSTAGAMGLFQVMPYHFSEGEDTYKPNINARRGLNYLKQALEAGNGNVRLALAGYNGGIAGAGRPESSWPAETLRYVYWGVEIYADATKGKSQSDRLNEWLNAGGASLCRTAAKNLGIGQ